MQRASVLNILMNAITVWNTIYLGKAIEYLRERNELNEDLLSHVSLLKAGSSPEVDSSIIIFFISFMVIPF